MVLDTGSRALLHNDAVTLPSMDVGGANDFTMKEIKAKTLTYCGEPIDERMLQSGIYTTSVPKLLSHDCTIESLIQYAELFDKGQHIRLFGPEYFNNLSQCKLVDVTVIIHDTTDEQ